MRKTTSNDFYHSVPGAGKSVRLAHAGGGGGAPAADSRTASLRRCRAAPELREGVCSGSVTATQSTRNEQQNLSLADYVQAALMLNYNNRSVG